MIPRAELAAIRFGMGLPAPPEQTGDPQTMLAGLAGADPMLTAWPGATLADAADLIRRDNEASKRLKKSNARADEQARATLRREGRSMVMVQTRIAFARALDAPSGFRERLVRFWTDHFTVTAKNSFKGLLPPAFANEAIRPHVNGQFADMLAASTLHPAMLDYLDQATSVGPNSRLGKKRRRGLNENLAREVIELHTLGVGAGYAQADVTQMAELLTGLTLQDHQFVFRPELAEPGAETVLGRTYQGDGVAPVAAVLNDLALRPETATHIARKLAVHFVADEPDPDMVAAMTRAFADSGGDLPSVYAAMLDHPAAWAEPLAKARQPFDFLAAALRALGLDGARVMDLPEGPFRRSLLQPMGAMGQPWQAPRGPDGWPEAAEAWITPQLLAARVTWAMAEPGRLRRDLPEPAEMVVRALGRAADERVVWAAARAETRAEAIGVILSSPGFNRR